MNMKHRLFVVVSTVVIAATPVMAQEHAERGGHDCSPAGVWLGGSDAAKYMMDIVPITPWWMNTVAQGTYLPSQTMNQVSSTWDGEMKRGPHGVWEGWAVQVSSTSGVLFPDPMDITIGGVRSVAVFNDCDTMTVTIDFFEIYLWNSIYGPAPTKVLLVDPGDIPAPPVPIEEVYHRVSVD